MRPNPLLVLARACHPLPCLVVTLLTTVLAAVVGNSAGTCALVAGAVLCGQLSIGWSNDRIDVERDRASGRRDKPLAANAVPLRLVEAAIGTAVAGCLALSLILGPRAGGVHLAAVASGWLYNLRLKSTVLSWLPYAFSFGALPAIATLALPDHPAPAPWAVAAAALLGVTAHLANAVPDLADDRSTGVLGLAHRLGAAPSLVLAGLFGAAASVLLVLGPAERPPPWEWAALAAVAAVTGAGLASARTARPNSRTAFRSVMAVAALDLVLVAAAGMSFAGH